MKKERIDNLLIESGLADSPSKAQALIMAGVVLADEKRVEKPSETFSQETVIRIKGDSPEARYASRGGLKLEGALREFEIDPTGLLCLDIGASTGGFTDCLLQHRASRVVAVDAGTNQIVWSLREDPRVDVREQTNARELSPTDFDSLFDLIVMDVSFISVTKIIPVLPPLLKNDGHLIILIKPQFEVRKGEVGKGGVVREPEKHQRVIEEVNASAALCGFVVKGSIDSPITGAEGNKEFLGLYEKETPKQEETPPKFVEGVDFYFESGLMVLTAHFLKNRGYCCGNGCRHCPYDLDVQSKNSSSSL
ncbi:MAG: TlyA family rRNA (cytidine-2'-O)-methyltransferase [Pyrinomonadaceae bacterium]